MDDKNSSFFDPNIPLILTNSIVNSSDNKKTLKNERYKIKNLIKKKYLINDNLLTPKLKNNFVNHFTNIKNQAQKINNDINETMNEQKKELKQLYHEKTLLDQNQIQSNIIRNTKKIIESYKRNTNEITSNFHDVKKKLEEKTHSGRKLEINNHELKKTVSRYITHTKNLEVKISQLDKAQLNAGQVDELNDKIKFFQKENIRLSGEITIVQKKYESIKENFTQEQFVKNNIYQQIKELNDSLTKNNVVDTPYPKEIINDDSINTNVLNPIDKNNLEEEKKTTNKKFFLDESVSDIFDSE
jgi:chromosome segregation ATPase